MLINAIMVVDADKTTAQDLALPRCLELGGESQLEPRTLFRYLRRMRMFTRVPLELQEAAGLLTVVG